VSEIALTPQGNKNAATIAAVLRTKNFLFIIVKIKIISYCLNCDFRVIVLINVIAKPIITIISITLKHVLNVVEISRSDDLNF
jgi:hypothetical protein